MVISVVISVIMNSTDLLVMIIIAVVANDSTDYHQWLITLFHNIRFLNDEL